MTVPPSSEAGESLAFARTGLTSSRARELELVLHSQALPCRSVPLEGSLGLQVRERDLDAARQLLDLYEEENRPAAPRAGQDAAVGGGQAAWAPAPLAFESSLLVALAMAGFYAVTGPRDPVSKWFAAGSADAARIAEGELWRAVTALTLHADAPHLLANLVFGTLFLTLAARILGPGLALLAVLAAGAAGNVLNALLRSADHVSVGASTAVFGAVGLLCGVAIVFRRRRRERWRRVLLPLAGGLGLLAMLGSGGGRVDVFAHLFGLMMGVPLGLAVALAIPRPPPSPVQLLLVLLCAAGLYSAWSRALAPV